ncbi:MAG: tryptophan 2,3-dioxygenase family protein, partial [Cyclobacteriaceae bacterium]
MEPEQFLQFRMSLLPASGFQSAQYRLIEIGATDLDQLWAADERPDQVDEKDIETIYQHMYWKKGAAELSTGKRTLTLRQFELKYDESFLQKARQRRTTNLRQQFVRNFRHSDLGVEIINALRVFDVLTNLGWPLSHYKSAARYLQGDPNVIAATGGTNWQKYLPPQRQRIIFFPDLFSEDEKAEWGKAGLMKSVLGQK